MKIFKEDWQETTIEEAVSLFGLGGCAKCIVPEEFRDDKICDEGDAEYTFDHKQYEDTMPLTKEMICYGKWYVE